MLLKSICSKSIFQEAPQLRTPLYLKGWNQLALAGLHLPYCVWFPYLIRQCFFGFIIGTVLALQVQLCLLLEPYRYVII